MLFSGGNRVSGAPCAAWAALPPLLRLPIQAPRGRHARQGLRGDLLFRAQDPCIRPAVDSHGIWVESAPRVVLRPRRRRKTECWGEE